MNEKETEESSMQVSLSDNLPLHHADKLPKIMKDPIPSCSSSLNTAEDQETKTHQQVLDDSFDIGQIHLTTIGDKERKIILQEKWKPPKQFTYPKNKQNRKYSPAWADKFPWLRYSQSKDAVFCSVCVCFSSHQQSNPEFVTKPFCDWKNACGQERGALPRHESSDAHQGALKMADDFLRICQEERKPITEYLSQAYGQKVEKNRHALLCILDVIISLAKRGIPLRGNWCKEQREEDSNFNFFIKWKAKDNPEFASFLENAPKNAKYLSPKIQNQLIECIAQVIRRRVVQEAMQADYFSIMADETCDASTTEQLSVCIRYIRCKDGLVGTFEVAEDFLGFIQLEEMNAEAITKALLENLRNWNVDLTKWRGKGFDGASVMSGYINGVSKRIQDALPGARFFTHCRNHCLNLVVVNSCRDVPAIRNCMDIFRDLSFFLNNSHKRKVILRGNVTEKEVDELLSDLEVHEEELLFASNRRQGLPTLCETRWLSRVDSVSTLLVKYDQVRNALEEVADKSSGKSRSDAQAYLKNMSEFWFIMTAVMVQYILAYVRPVSVTLQSKQCDLVKAHEECQGLLQVIKDQRNEATFHRLYSRATTILKTNYGENEEPEVQRTSAGKRQKHRANAPAMNTEEFYKRNYYFPFLDHVVSHLQSRFPAELQSALLAFHLMPQKVHEITEEKESEIQEQFNNDMPSPENFHQELDRWRHKVSRMKPEEKGKPLVDLLSKVERNFYPNLHAVLSLLLTLPVGSCSCERSFSALRRLKTWSRTSMGEMRLNGLAMAHMHKDHPLVKSLDPLEILKEWDASMHRRIVLAFDHSA